MLAVAVALSLGGCVLEPEKPKVKADAGGPDKSLAVSSDVAAGTSQDFALNVGRRTFFREGSAELDSVAKETVDKQAAWLVQHPSWKVQVQGFADDPGSKEANLDLSRRRAEAVKAFMVSLGVEESRIHVVSLGRERLVRDCPDLSCKAQNRRVITNLEASQTT